MHGTPIARTTHFLSARCVGVALVSLVALIAPGSVFAQFSDASAEIDFLRTGSALSDGLAGAAWLDFNNDGNIDLFLPNGAGSDNKLFRNEGDGTFTDIAASAGVANGVGNVSALAGDINNDGLVDLFLTGDGAGAAATASGPKLYLNNGDETFSDITDSAGISDDIEGYAAAFGDINNDSYLDIFICSPGNLATGVKKTNVLLLNGGNLTFADISAAAGIDTDLGACVVSFHDYDDDGYTDIFVGNCNDFVAPLNPIPGPFELFRNNGDLTFTDVAADAGLAPSDGGDPTIGMGFPMGLAFADYDGDGDTDFFVTSVGSGIGSDPISLHQLYEKDDTTYTNVAAAAGVAEFEFGWGAAPLDFDNDGQEDLFYTGSLPLLGIIGEGEASPGRLFRNTDGAFTPTAEYGLEEHYSSGVAVADYDNNGYPDIVVVAHDIGEEGHRSLLLQNEGGDNNWITICAEGTESNRSAVGAVVTVQARRFLQSGFRHAKEIFAGSSFSSTNSPWLTFGLGNFRSALIRVDWPSGLSELYLTFRVNRKITLVEGEGVPVPGDDDPLQTAATEVWMELLHDAGRFPRRARFGVQGLIDLLSE